MEQTKTSEIVCNVCGAEVSTVLISKGGHHVYQCTACGLAFTHPQPQAIDEQYDYSYFDLYRKRRKFRLERANTRLKAIELIGEPGRLLDIGCSLGYFVEAANARGWCASGIEISPFASEEARQLGLDVRTGILEDAGHPDASFECVTMWDVLEHVPDPTAHMLGVHRILSSGGLVVIGTPNLAHVQFRRKREQWRHLKPAEHIFYFQESSISLLLRKTGFRIVTPPVLGGRRFSGCLGAAARSAFGRVFHINDVMTIYGVKDEL